MKRALLVLLAIILLLPSIAIGEELDKSILEQSEYFSYDKFTKRWLVYGTYVKEYSTMVIEMYLILYDMYIDNRWGPELRVTVFDVENGFYNTVGSVRAIVDGTLYSVEELSSEENHASAFGSTGIRAFWSGLVNAREVAFQFGYKDRFGSSYSVTIDPVDISALKQLRDVAKLIEASNAWSVVPNPDAEDITYGVSVELLGADTVR